MWHVSSRSGVATLRTAIHLLLTYLTVDTRFVTHAERRQMLTLLPATVVQQLRYRSSVISHLRAW